MIAFFYGFFGALVCIGLAALAGLCGWMACAARQRKTAPGNSAIREDNRQLMQEQAAFRQLQNYSAERAYGLLDDREGDEQ